MPVLDKITEGKTRISNAATFHCLYEENSLCITENGSKIHIGRTVTYIVNDAPPKPKAFAPGESFSNISV